MQSKYTQSSKDNKRVSRKDKKILRAIMLCHTGNPECRESHSKHQYLEIKKYYSVWFKTFSLVDRKNANTVKKR